MIERQVSFAGGELAPTLWGRTDIDQYPAGARQLRNFLVTPHGVLYNRPGFQHVDHLGTSKCRLVPFVVDENTSFVLVFRVDRNGIPVFKEDATDGRHAFSYVANIWGDRVTEDELDGMRFVQAGLYLTVTMPNYNPVEIVYDIDAGSWDRQEIDFTPTPVPTDQQDMGFEPRLHFQTAADEAEAGQGPIAETDSDHPARPWSWVASYIIRRGKDQQLYETTGLRISRQHLVGDGSVVFPDSLSAIGVKHVIYPDRPLEFFMGWSGGFEFITHPDGTRDYVVKSRLYRGRDGHFGFVAEGSGSILVDDGADPDFSNPPRAAVPPWWVVDSDEAEDFRIEKPLVPFFFESRRILAAPAERPAIIWGSSIEQHDNFDEVIPADDSDAYELTLAGKQRQIIRWIEDLGSLLVGSSGGVWLVQGAGEGEIITPNSIWAHQLFGKGVGTLSAETTGEALFFTELKGGHPYSAVRGEKGFQFTDLSLVSSHLFDGYTIKDWAYADSPQRTLWVARSDGALLSLTYVPEMGMAAWARHELAGGGKVESLCTKPEAYEDGVWAVVMYEDAAGTERRYLMRMGKRLLPLQALEEEPDVRYALFLDRSVSYYGKAADTYVLSFAGADMTIGDQDVIGITGGISIVAGDVLSIDDPEGGAPYKIRIDSDDGDGAYTVTLMNRELEGSLTGSLVWWLCSSTLAGLDHLDGTNITVVADGDVWTDVPVQGGSIDLGERNEAGILHAGVGYVSDFESLDIIKEKGKEKIIKGVRLELEHTRGGEVGQDFDDLTAVPTRDVEHGYLTHPLSRVEVEVLVNGSWDTRGKAVFRQSDPMPVTILGLTREYEQGGR